MKKEMNNKGFSLVELIVVIAIMAVLVGVLAPQFLRYVEKSRLQKDNQAIAEIASAAKAAMANEKIYDAVTGTVTCGTINNKEYKFGTTATASLNGELANTVGTSVKLTSKTYTAAPAVKVRVDTATKTVIVWTDGYIEDVNATGTARTF